MEREREVTRARCKRAREPVHNIYSALLHHIWWSERSRTLAHPRTVSFWHPPTHPGDCRRSQSPVAGFSAAGGGLRRRLSVALPLRVAARAVSVPAIMPLCYWSIHLTCATS